MMNIDFRCIKPDESPQYRKLRLEALQSYPDAYASKYDEEAQKNKLFFETQIENNSADNIMLGAFNGPELIGITGLIAQGPDRFQIAQMYVKQDYSGLGVGRQLLDLAKSCLKEGHRDVLQLTVYSTNAGAVKVYLTSGFKPLTQTEAEIVMEYRLSPSNMEMY